VVKMDSVGSRAVFSLMLLLGLFYLPAPAFSQDNAVSQNLILNGGFEEGFQGDFGVAYGWGGFSNGNAVVGWNGDSWGQVVVAGQNAQMIEIKDAAELNRYAGIYQTMPVVPGEQYKLSINGLIRSTEGDIRASDFGYRLQYAVDYEGGTTWELLDDEAWLELPWDEQPLNLPAGSAYRIDHYETTITAKSNQLTLFIRGWKKWINNGAGIFDLDELSLVGPVPAGFQTPQVQAAAVGNPLAPIDESQGADSTAQTPTNTRDAGAKPAQSDLAPPLEASSQPDQATPHVKSSQLPVSGQGPNESVGYIILSSGILLLVLFVGAVTATMRPRSPVEQDN
jgi:hypothetical protein